MANIGEVNSVATNFFGVTKTPAKGKMDMDAFMRLLTVQLANQNPLEPMNDRDFFAQMAQLGQVQGNDKMQDQLRTMQATNLMGKTVDALRPMTDEGANSTNQVVSGKVVRMSIKNGEYILGIKEDNGGIAEVKLDNLREIRE